jgi:hypothetical protein
VDIGQLFEGMGIIHGGAAVRYFDMTPPSSRSNTMNRLAVPLRRILSLPKGYS